MSIVSMGEIVISSEVGEELVAYGLGSCIGLALVDRVAGVAGMAHIVLPEAQGKQSTTGKFADLAVPALIAEICTAGAVKRRLEAAIAGGARMFELSDDLDIGGGNEEAVREQLTRGGGGVRASGRRSNQRLCTGAPMSEMLNNDQIAALVDAAKKGQLPEQGAAPGNRRGPRLRTVDFSRPT